MLHSSRRAVLAAAATALPGLALGRVPSGLPQAPYFYRFKVGTVDCTVVTDGVLPLGDPNASFINIAKDEIARELTDNFLPTNDALLEQNILVATIGERTVLFDTGMGRDTLFGPTTGRMLPSLRAAGIDRRTSTRW